jgi:glycyl-tRNA synthetase
MSETADQTSPEILEKVTALCKHRGFIFPSAEIYGGFRSAYDYGPLGVNLLRNIKAAWWKSMVQLRSDIVGLDAAILNPPAAFEASGHLSTFTDPLVDCLGCKERWREDKIDGVCPKCGSTKLTSPRDFNLMFKTHAGPIEGAGSVAYLRPETAQGIFTNFANVLTTTRKKPPFGIAQIGKSFRNEITPQNYVFRTREFEQMEMEFFVAPEDAERWYRYWIETRLQWYLDLGIPEDQLRLHEHAPEDLAHYSLGTTDIEFLFPWGWDELEGVANRGDYDLTQHSAHSGVSLDYFDQSTKERYTPYVIEPAAGATRVLLALLLSAYHEDEVAGKPRTLLSLNPGLSPYQIAVLPVSNKPELIEATEQLLGLLRPHFMCDYDITQSLGKRYRRQDEIGTPYCVTVDFETLTDGMVTVRDRDSTEQVRLYIKDVAVYLKYQLSPDEVLSNAPRA